METRFALRKPCALRSGHGPRGRAGTYQKMARTATIDPRQGGDDDEEETARDILRADPFRTGEFLLLDARSLSR
jgi:hypothetical protein